MAGEWWRDGDGGGARVSVEQEFAEPLGLSKLGDALTYDVAGEPVDGARHEPARGALGLVPAEFLRRVLARRAGAGDRHADHQRARRARAAPALVELVRRFPEVTIIDIDALLTQVRDVMDKAALAVQYVFLFTLLAGLMVLLAAVQATRDERRYESAMLRTLGASRRVVFQGVAAEFVVLGALAGLLAAAGATRRGIFPRSRGLRPGLPPDPWVWVAGLAGGALLVGTAGRARRTVGRHAPADGSAT